MGDVCYDCAASTNGSCPRHPRLVAHGWCSCSTLGKCPLHGGPLENAFVPPARDWPAEVESLRAELAKERRRAEEAEHTAEVRLKIANDALRREREHLKVLVPLEKEAEALRTGLAESEAGAAALREAADRLTERVRQALPSIGVGRSITMRLGREIQEAVEAVEGSTAGRDLLRYVEGLEDVARSVVGLGVAADVGLPDAARAALARKPGGAR